jgi:hypothetical protein
VQNLADIPRWYEDVTDSASPARFARRSLLRAAVLGRTGETRVPVVPTADAATGAATGAAEKTLLYTVTGRILDVSPHILVLLTDRGEQRFALAAAATAWRGGPVSPAALRPGDRAILRRSLPGGPVVDRIWAEIGRVTGTIIEREGPGRLLVDEGPAKGRRIVMIPPAATGRIQVRFPRLEPGYLIDVIGLTRDGFLHALIPATAQPPYRAGHQPGSPMVSGHIPNPVSGTAVWHEPGEEPYDLLGLAYPALDPETSCEHRTFGPSSFSGDQYAVDPHATGPGCVRLPYLSVGSLLRLRNDCSERTRLLPVTSCGATARLFCDRCVTCGTSPRGRIADLTMAAFVELGGALEAGCFNATMMIGG